MRCLLSILLISLIPARLEAKRIYLVKALYESYQDSKYTWVADGQPIGIRSKYVNLDFDDTYRTCRFNGVSGDSLSIVRIHAFKDTVVTGKEWDHTPGLMYAAGWEYGEELSRKKRRVTTRYQMPLRMDTLRIPLAQISRIRTYKMSVQTLKDRSFGLGALLPPIFVYLFIIHKHPARDYPLKKWRFMSGVPFEKD